MPTRLTLTRHGETDWNVQRIWQGWSDIPLNDTGRSQAAQLAEQLRELNVTRIISSPLSRAHHTASIVGEALGLPVEVDERLKEIHVGDCSGLTADQIRTSFQFFMMPFITPGKWKSLSQMAKTDATSMNAPKPPCVISRHAGQMSISSL